MATYKTHAAVNKVFFERDVASLAEIVRATGESEADVADVLESMTRGAHVKLRRMELAGTVVYELAPKPETCYFCSCIINANGGCACSRDENGAWRI